MKLWAGRFGKATDQLVDDFHSSISFDQRLFEQDIQGSIAHATMLGEQGIIPREDAEKIVAGLKGILEDAREGKIEWQKDAEDIHMNVEALLTERIGEAGKRLHTGRSRNDQVALDTRMYARTACRETESMLEELIRALLDTAQENLHTVMPGYTHLQKAQPITLAHHLTAYVQMFLRDRDRFRRAYDAADVMVLGSGALAGNHLSPEPGAGGGAAGLFPDFREQPGRRVRPGFPAGLSFRCRHLHDASEPLLRGADPLEHQ